ncbi:CoA transferase, partial [Pseudomonadota bacterium]
GGQIDVSLYDTLLSQLNYLAADYLNGGEEPKRYRGGGHPYLVPAQLFPTKDGFVALFISHDQFWRKFAQAVGRKGWIEDPRVATVQARMENRDQVVSDIQSIFVERETAHWVSLLEAAGVVIAGVQTLASALNSELAASRDMVIEIPVPDGIMRFVGNPLKMAGCSVPEKPAPLLGEHTEAICGKIM